MNFTHARIPVTTVFIMDKRDDENQPAIWIADGEIDARRYVKKHGLVGLVRFDTVTTFDYPLYHDEITGKIVKKYVDIFN